jgi:Family of unknown function (DUF5684)
MKRSLWALGSILTLFVVFTPAVALAQDNNDAVAGGLLAGFLLVYLLVGVAYYVYIALSLQTIANKTNTENAWLAWIPLVNIFLMVNIAQKPGWWFILCLIPFVNIVMLIIIWMAIAERRGKPSWWGIMWIVPVMNIIMPGYLAWSD